MVVMGDELRGVCDKEVGTIDTRGGICAAAEALLRLGGSEDSDIPFGRETPLDIFSAVEDLITGGGDCFWVQNGLWIRGYNENSPVENV